MIGFKIEVIPDFLNEHRFSKVTKHEKIEEFLEQWAKVLGALWKYRGVYAFCLRFVGGITKGKIDCLLIAAATIDRPFPGVAEDLELLFRGFGVRLTRIKNAAFHLKMLDFPDGHTTWELTQGSSLEIWDSATQTARDFGTLFKGMNKVDLDPANLKAVVPLGWWVPFGNFLEPFSLLVNATHPVYLSIFLEPTEMRTEEKIWLRQMSAFAASSRTFKAKVHGIDGQEIMDLGAEVAADLFGANLRRLSYPFLCSVQVATQVNNSIFGYGLIQALAAIARESSGPQGVNRSSLVSGFQVFRHGQSSAISSQFSRIGFDCCFQSRHADDLYPSGLSRFKYLVDARGASTVFRLPVSLEGGIPGIEVVQSPPDFNPGHQGPGGEPSILIGVRSDGGEISVKVKDFAKHALITGFTGTGKTNTVLHLLDQFWRNHKIPFLVIESAKAEYRGFIKVGDIPGQKAGFMGLNSKDQPNVRIYTIGNESCSPFRLNPFELQEGVRLESHIGRLQACFEAAIPQGSSGGPVPSLLSDALPLIYQEKGWSLLDEGYPRGTSPLRFPTMADLKDMLVRLLEKPGPENSGRGRGYTGEVLNNLKGFILGRVGALLQGSRGLMFGTQYSVPLDELFNTPSIIELNDLNEADKGLVVMFLLVMLREYREKNKFSGSLGHVTVVEEAHNVLSNPAPGTASEAQEKAVQAFCNMLAEIRSLGEGLIIADQSPQKLARDAIRNTNVQITHALRDSVDRDAIADCSLMTEEQRDYLGKIRTGKAATFFMGLEKATFVKIPEYAKKQKEEEDPEGRSGRGTGFSDVSNDEVRVHMQELNVANRNGPLFDLCGPCRKKCDFRKNILQGRTKDPKELQVLSDQIKVAAATGKPDDLIQRHAIASAQLAVWSEIPGDDHSLWCAAIHLVSPGFFGVHRKPGDYRRALIMNKRGFRWILRKYPKKYQNSQPG